jgi:hypothetical protein
MEEKNPSFKIPNNNFFDANHVNLTFSVPPNNFWTNKAKVLEFKVILQLQIN